MSWLPIVLALLPGQTQPLENLAFQKGSLAGWEGHGFYLSAGQGRGADATFGVSSSDAGSKMRTGQLRYNFQVPARASRLTFQSYVSHSLGLVAERNGLDVLLTGPDGKPAPKKVRVSDGWMSAPELLPPAQGQPREYSIDIGHLRNRAVQLVLADRDPRPGCYLYVTGFKMEEANAPAPALATFNDRDFVAEMAKLQAANKLPAMRRYESKRFLGVGNADESFCQQRLRFCEIFYDLFMIHFQNRGFAVRHPSFKLPVAIMNSRDGFDAYFGQKMGGVLGIYDPKSNRLIIYDVHHDDYIQKGKQAALDKTKNLKGTNKTAQQSTIERQFRDFATDLNLTVVMHETAHQISFNCGLLNRNGDCPGWLAEGLACYCEAVDRGDFQAIGASNPERIEALKKAKAKGRMIPLEKMIVQENWRGSADVLTGYGQSWALYRMLMHQRPAQLKQYLTLIHGRQAPEHRKTDFVQCFGDFAAFESQYNRYVDEMIAQYQPVAGR